MIVKLSNYPYKIGTGDISKVIQTSLLSITRLHFFGQETLFMRLFLVIPSEMPKSPNILTLDKEV